MKTDIVVSNLIGNYNALRQTKKTLVLCYFMLDKIEKLDKERLIENVSCFVDECEFFVDFSALHGLCSNCLYPYPDANSTLFKRWDSFSGVDSYPIKPSNLKVRVNAYEICMNYYETSNLYKGRNLNQRKNLLIYIILQLEWALGHKEGGNFNPFECIDAKHWTHSQKKLKRLVKRLKGFYN